MRRLLALAVASALLGAGPSAAPVNYNAFGVTVLQRLSSQSHDGNVFISPVSLGVALAMAADGAAGTTREALLAGLHVNGADLAGANAALIASLRENHDAQVALADAIWLRQDVPPTAHYVALLHDRYDAVAQAVHFGEPSAAAAINDWVRRETHGLIGGIVSETSPFDFAYLTNALAFKGAWTTPFDPHATRTSPFTDAKGAAHNVSMMFRTGAYDVASMTGYRALRLPYGKGGYALYVLLPSTNDAGALVRSLRGTAFDGIAHAMQTQEIEVGIPRFTLQYDASLADVLERMGMGIAFSADADFSPMHPPPPHLRIAKVLHKTYLRIDEAGTTAAAATAVGMQLTAIRVANTPPFIVDRPFVLAIRDEHTGALLFVGIVNSLPS
jgi:serine protease inhibitor